MTAALPFRIFLATPGDLVDERAAVRSCVDEYHRRHGREGGVTYEIVEWDQTRGTARRAQEAINELIAESHFMITMFKRAWGSTPGSPWGYTSGTEEELFTGLLELGQFEQPMRDVWVAFVRDSDPDPRITSLRQQIIDQHAIMFEEVTDLRDRKTRVAGLLRTWEERATNKIPRLVDLVPSSGKEVRRVPRTRRSHAPMAAEAAAIAAHRRSG